MYWLIGFLLFCLFLISLVVCWCLLCFVGVEFMLFALFTWLIGYRFSGCLIFCVIVGFGRLLSCGDYLFYFAGNSVVDIYYFLWYLV